MRHAVAYLCAFFCSFGSISVDAQIKQLQLRTKAKLQEVNTSLSSFSLPGTTELSRGNLVGTVISPPTDYRLHFFITPTKHSHCDNIIHFTADGDYGPGFRVPAIWFCSGFYVAFGDSQNHNRVWRSGRPTLNVETEFELVVAGSRAKIFLDSVLVHQSHVYPRMQLDHLDVYLGDPWFNPAKATVRDVVYEAAQTVDPYHSTFSFPGSIQPAKGTLAAEVIDVPTDYELVFKITPTGTIRGWRNVMHFSLGGNCCSYGDRSPAVWFAPGSTRLYVVAGHINDPNADYYSPRPGLPLNVETEFKLIVAGAKASVFLNSKLVGELSQGPRTKFEYLQFWLSDPWYGAAKADISDISFGPAAITESPSPIVNITGTARTGDGLISSFDQISYGEGQDYEESTLVVSTDFSTVSMEGNIWRALPIIPPITVNEKTVIEFDFKLTQEAEINAICLDEDLDVIPDFRCFVLAGTQGERHGMYDFDNQASVGDTEKHFVIPIGSYYTGVMNYLAFVQDNDRKISLGSSEFSNIRIYEQVFFPLKVSIDGTLGTLPIQNQVEYGEVQDYAHNFLSVSDDGFSIHMRGNVYKAIPFVDSVHIGENMVLDFYFEVEEEAEFNAICLEEDLVLSPGKRCFVITEAATTVKYMYKIPEVTSLETGQRHYRIPVGRYFSGYMNYIVFVQDHDADILGGASTFKNISLFEPSPLEIKVNGVTKALSNQLSYGVEQDEKAHMIVVSEDNKSSGGMLGNTWKALEFPEPITVTKNTIISFDFDLQNEVDLHAICLDDDLENGFGSEDTQRCLVLAGSQKINDKYHVLEKASLSETHSYIIQIGAYFTGEMKYLGFVQDNDEEPFLAGASSFSNIEIFDGVSCLQNTNFDFDFSECTLDNFLNGIKTELDTNHPTCINDATVELVTLFGVADQAEVTEKVGDVCAQAYAANHFSFDQITLDEYQFDEEFFDGGTAWNYEKQTVQDGENTKVLSEDAVMVRVRNADIAKTRGISWPTMHNFGFGKCEVPAAMCCWVADRQANDDGGTCSSEGCNDADPDDNSDLCYVDFTRFRQSAHVHDGYSIYGNGAEGNLNCHGFAWDNFSGSSQNALKGNLLFEVSMNMGLIEHGYVEQVPGAPMCGCVESMPVVSRADCTELEVNQYINVRYRGKYERFTAKVNITNISYSPCSGKTSNDFSSYFRSLVDAGKATVVQEVKFNQQIVGAEKCGTAIGDFLMNKGFSSGFYQGKTYLPASNVVMGPYLYASEIDLFTDGTPDANVWYKTPHGDIFNKNDNYYVDLDLGEVFDISRIVVWHYYHDQRRYFSQTVEISMDGLSFETVWETGIGRLGAVETVAGNSIDLYKPISGRYVRHRCGHNTRNHGVHFVEMAVYA
mmetsp:Transcript_13869/g.20258  ORF Transcript_13869/g.20258 Transcript_13869/m.20258 type:complete len:1374 (+) Transcript_13869:108-4229(+)